LAVLDGSCPGLEHEIEILHAALLVERIALRDPAVNRSTSGRSSRRLGIVIWMTSTSLEDTPSFLDRGEVGGWCA